MRPPRPGPAGCRAGGYRTVRALAARRPPVPTLDGVPSAVGRGRVLSGLRHRRDPGALASRLRPPTHGPSRVTDPWTRAPTVRSPDHHRPDVFESERLRAGRAPGPTRLADLRSLRVEYRRPGRGTRPPGAARTRQRRQGRPRPATTRSGPGHRPAVDERTAGPILRNTHARRKDRHAATRRLKHLAHTAGIRMPRMHPHMLRHTFVTTMLDAGVSLRDVQIAARHADPRTTMRYDRARKNLDRHPNYILAAYMASGT
ncbi:tyrosine-type recombinase/integrase [Micromonospora sediminimaris]|uniref:tyrosine-type recombinase/integrase n=1 Tax=Micromonospora sediminimaris TaxID=547162 RepID=UPI0037B46094